MKNILGRWFRGVVSALVYTAIDSSGVPGRGRSKNEVVEYVLRQHSSMPDFLRFPLVLLTLFFDLSGWPGVWGRFQKQEPSQRRARRASWAASPFGTCRDLMRFYDSLAVLAWTSTPESAMPPRKHPAMPSRNFHQVVVLGSGPGGAVTAALLAEKGFDVALLEEGPNLPLESCQPFSIGEMLQKYRNGGLTPAFGRPKVAYVEGCIAGGGSEINSGLYHRTPTEILDSWKKRFALEAEEKELQPHFEACERDLNVCRSPGALPKASLKLQEGADKLGWQAKEVPRWFAYDGGVDVAGIPTGVRQTMSRTLLRRFSAAGGTFSAGIRASKIARRFNHFEIRASQAGSATAIKCENLFVSCGAIGTPALLQKSGIRGRFGHGLQMHPTVKVVAEFDEEVNSEQMGVPVHQVKEFAPAFSFGCSISSLPYLALGLLDHPGELAKLDGKWKRMAVYYAMIVPTAEGAVTILPSFRDPLVRFQLTAADLALLATALRRLCELLFSAGAVRLMPSISKFGTIEKPTDLSRIPSSLPAAFSNLMTIHLFSSCRMGENRSLCPVDSFGAVRGVDGLHIADAGVLPSAPGVNPQGSLMAFARRNALHFADKNLLH